MARTFECDDVTAEECTRQQESRAAGYSTREDTDGTHASSTSSSVLEQTLGGKGVM